MKFGRKRPTKTVDTHPHLYRALSRYCPVLPKAPAVVDYWTGAADALRDVLGNDRLGDCTAAGAVHLDEAMSAAAGAPVVLTAKEAVDFYSLSTGYNPDDPATDQGGDEITVLSTWRDKGLDGQGLHKILGWASVEPHNVHEIRTAAWLFGLYFGVELPDAWTQPFPSGDGFTWDAAEPDDQQGHCFVSVGADDSGVQIDTWGLCGTMTYDAVAKLCAASAYGNLFAVFTEDSISKCNGLAGCGFDRDQLMADLGMIG